MLDLWRWDPSEVEGWGIRCAWKRRYWKHGWVVHGGAEIEGYPFRQDGKWPLPHHWKIITASIPLWNKTLAPLAHLWYHKNRADDIISRYVLQPNEKLSDKRGVILRTYPLLRCGVWSRSGTCPRNRGPPTTRRRRGQMVSIVLGKMESMDWGYKESGVAWAGGVSTARRSSALWFEEGVCNDGVAGHC